MLIVFWNLLTAVVRLSAKKFLLFSTETCQYYLIYSYVHVE